MTELLLDQTLFRFPTLAQSAIEIQPVEKGGSDRRYYRIRAGEQSLILVKYGSQREENRHYVAIARFLAQLGARVPTIYFHDDEEGLIWMEDLGELDLWAFRQAPWSRRGDLYRKTLDQALLLHSRNEESARSVTLQAGFDADLYRWEQGYFFDHCLGRFFNRPAAEITGLREAPIFEQIAVRLAGETRVLVHRDFQSQNVMILRGEPYLIDFQGLRAGLAQYDLASLLYDPYVVLLESERRELLHYYMERLSETGQPPAKEFLEIFDLCALQRLMQALGAYGFLGLVKERRAFLEHIPAALENLRMVVDRIPGLEAFGSTLAELGHEPAR